MSRIRFWRKRPLALECVTLLLSLWLVWPALAVADSDSSRTSLADHNWFFIVTSGVGRSWYDDSTQGRIDQQKSVGGTSPNVASFDLPGIYRRIRPGLAAGLLLNATFEHVARRWQEQNSLAVHTYNPSASVLWFPGGRTGEGWFTRGELGHSRLLITREVGSEFHREIDTGVFGQGSMGYAWRAGDVARLLLHLSLYRAQGASLYSSGLFYNIGFLF